MSTLSLPDECISNAVNHSISLMPKSAANVARGFAQKNIAEVKAILRAVSHMTSPRILDIGCGTGVTISAIKLLLPNAECYGMDRFEEFSPALNREAGSTPQIVERLSKLGVIVIQASFSDVDLLPASKFDCITTFDVIEHLSEPLDLLGFIDRHLKPSSCVVIGTPNQVHLLNRVRSLLGLNTWEDFAYWLSDSPFFGHVRELTPYELSILPFRSACHSYTCYINWPLSRLHVFLRIFLVPFFSIPGFGLYMTAVYKN